MIEILCDECNGNMFVDEVKTLQEYARELGYEILTGGEIKDNSLQNYTVFRCGLCSNIKKMTFEELEFQFRRSIAVEALKFRMVMNKKTLDTHVIDFDSKMFYCGKCVGIDEQSRDGYCLEGVAKYCRIYKGLKT